MVEAVAVRGDIFAESDEDVAEKNRDAGDGFGVDFTELRFVFGIVDEMDAQFLQERAEVVLNFNAMEVHGDFEIGDRIGAEQDFMILADVQEFDGENVGGLAKLGKGEKLGRWFVKLAGPPMDDAGEASEIAGPGGAQDA